MYLSTCFPSLLFKIFYTFICFSFLFFCLLIHPLIPHHTFFFSKISFFIKKDFSFQVLGCMFVTSFVLHVKASYTVVCSWHNCHMSFDRWFKVLWEMWVQLFTFEAVGLFLLQCIVFQNKKPTLGQILIIFHDFCIVFVKPNCSQYFIFYGQIALWPISYAANMLVAKRCLWQRYLQQNHLERNFRPTIITFPWIIFFF